ANTSGASPRVMACALAETAKPATSALARSFLFKDMHFSPECSKVGAIRIITQFSQLATGAEQKRARRSGPLGTPGAVWAQLVPGRTITWLLIEPVLAFTIW